MKSVRLPLYLGADALWYAAAASALVLPGGILSAAGGYALAQGQGGLLWLLVGVPAVLLGLGCVVLAWAARVSDVVLDAHEIRVEGGAHDGVVVPWSKLARVSLEDHADARLTLHTTESAYVVAEVSSQSERASVKALHRTLAATLGEQLEPPPTAAEIATCAGCGAPLVPDDHPVLRCRSCGRDNPVAAQLRDRLGAGRAAARATVDTSAAVKRLLDQPGATRAGVILVLASLGVTAGWAAVTFAYQQTGVGSLDGFSIGVGIVNGWALTFACFSTARIALARRRALIVLATTFGARPPRAPGQGPGCRRCGAPLPTTAGIVARCVYCGTESVLETNIAPLVERVRDHQGSIADLLASTRSERWLWAKLGIAAAAATVLASVGVASQLSVAREVADNARRCETGARDACFRLATSYAVGSVVREDKETAYRLYARACDLGHAEACRERALCDELGIGAPQDVEKAKNAYARACELGFDKACAERRELDAH